MRRTPGRAHYGPSRPARRGGSERAHTQGETKGSSRVEGQILDIQKVGVVGGGTMGSGIAEVCARAGLDTRVVEIDAAVVEQVTQRIGNSLGKAHARGRITAETHDVALAGLSYSHELADLADRDLVIEAVIENLPEKRRIFGLLDDITAAHAVLASNTSSIAIIDLATATNRPRAGGRHALLQPRPGAAAGGGGAVGGRRRAGGRCRRGLRHRRAGQARHPLRGPGRVRGEPPAGALPAVGDRSWPTPARPPSPTSTPA